MYTILIILFFVIMSLLISLAIVSISAAFNKKGENLQNNTEEINPKQLKKTEYLCFVQVFFLLIFFAQIILLLPAALAFSKVHSFIIFQNCIALLLLLLNVHYAVKRNIIRIKQN